MPAKEAVDFKCPSCGVALNVLISKKVYKNKPTENTNEAVKAWRVESVSEGKHSYWWVPVKKEV